MTVAKTKQQIAGTHIRSTQVYIERERERERETELCNVCARPLLCTAAAVVNSHILFPASGAAQH